MTTPRIYRRITNDMKRHPWIHIFSVSTIAVALTILGIFLLGYRNIGKLTEQTQPLLVGTLYLKEEVGPIRADLLREKILKQDIVESVNYKSKEAVMGELLTFLGKVGVEGFTGDTLVPDILEVKIKPHSSLEQMNSLKSSLMEFTEIAQIDFSEDWVGQYHKFLKSVRFAGIVLFMIVFVGCSFIIGNFMGIRHQARKQEIEIIHLIGGQQDFIFLPYLWEAIFEGIAGAIVASVGILFFRNILSDLLATQWTTLMGIKEWWYISFAQFLLLAFLGILISLCGSVSILFRFQEDFK